VAAHIKKEADDSIESFVIKYKTHRKGKSLLALPENGRKKE